ncbi:opine metallophore biosynthesis dehydrogenase [Clostridium sp. OS1-26]|uniref:opine metallophore biosynthesis dehydrogenase n=1 Tax=Clostridium sp. OS1-26 TaxID=3070681 RepID=UPI0027E17C6B|nr:opine metallophore biosynthesis dehydrogenase [Clostridium sp. OS1-26]WML33699.1 opine metallophore biosynthesis dehydrogenase [Clostridium sp. OS1-26]
MSKNVYRNLKNTLIVGSGPVAINMLINLSKGFSDEIGMVTRDSDKTTKFFRELKDNDFTLKGNVSKRELSSIEGSYKLQNLYIGCSDIQDIWETIVLCIPCDCYMEVLKKLDFRKLKKTETIILVSPEFGSSILISNYLKMYERSFEIISLSNYFGATKYTSPESLLKITTKALKKKIYLGSTLKNNYKIQVIKNFFEKIGIDYEVLDEPLEVESKNITVFVHPAFLISRISLNKVFDYDKTTKYIYKLYPEGPITMKTISIMRSLWKEISDVYINLKIEPINLLKFLNDDNYPVLEESIPRANIDNFMTYDRTKQEYLLYVRYSSILIDPFSIPDENGRYFDFSKVSYPKIYKDNLGKWNIPRMPLEDYKKISLLYSIGEMLNIKMVSTKYLINLFEIYLNKFIEDKGKKNINSNIFKNVSINNAKIIVEEKLNEDK